MLKIHDIVLPNGLRVVYTRTEQQIIQAQLQINAGWLHERPGEEGLAHLTEHVLCTSGTINGQIHQTPAEVKSIFEEFGCSNAATNPKTMSRVGSFLPEQLSDWLEIAPAQFFMPLFDNYLFETERATVLNEMQQQRSGPAYYHNIQLRDLLVQDQKLKRDGYGDRIVIERATLKNIVNYHQRGFNVNNSILFLVGALPQNIDECLLNTLGKYQQGDKQELDLMKSTSFQHKQKVIVHAPYLIDHSSPINSMSHLNCLYRMPETNLNDDGAALALVRHVLGGCGAKAILHQVLREENRLTYGVNSSMQLTSLHQIYQVDLSVAPDNVDLAEQMILECIAQLQNNLLSDSTMHRVRNDLRFGLACVASDINDQMRDIQNYVDFGLDPNTYISQLYDVTPADIQRVTQKYLPTKDSPYLIFIRNPYE